MNALIFIRFAYWLGALLDFWIGLQLIFPKRFGPPLGIRSAPTDPEMQYTLRLGTGLTFGWTALLIWGSLRPVENRAILLLTVVPVMLGLLLSTAAGFRSGYLSKRAARSTLLFEAAVALIFLAAYFLASGMAN